MTTDPAITREIAHQARRDGRAVATEEAWPFVEHRPMSDVLRAELAAVADQAGRKAEAAFSRSVTP